jgi:hypothetical protein
LNLFALAIHQLRSVDGHFQVPAQSLFHLPHMVSNRTIDRCVIGIDTTFTQHILLNEITESQQVAAISRNLLSVVSKPLQLSGHECGVTTSIGVAMFPKRGLRSPFELRFLRRLYVSL